MRQTPRSLSIFPGSSRNGRVRFPVVGPRTDGQTDGQRHRERETDGQTETQIEGDTNKTATDRDRMAVEIRTKYTRVLTTTCA